MTATVPRKQNSTQEQWEALIADLRADPDTPARARCLVEQAAHQLHSLIPRGATVAYAWSGGKDSQALRAVAETAGITEAVLVLTDLEFPEFVAFCTAQMPDGLTVVKRPWDLTWLTEHQDMIWPSGSTPMRWFSGVQHWGQRRYAADHHITHLLLGRRGADGNYRGPNGNGSYTDPKGFERVSPIFDWTHDDVLTVCVGMGLPLAPIYHWPRGFRVGTGPWPARQWCDTPDQGWAETYTIDAGVVEQAAQVIPDAARWLERHTQ